MKTRITVETTLNQEVVVGLMQTGELRKASQEEIRSYFDALVFRELNRLSKTADELTTITRGSDANDIEV